MKKLLNISTLLTGILIMSTAYGKQQKPFVILSPVVTGLSSGTMEYKPGRRFKKDPSVLDEETRIKIANKERARRANKANKGKQANNALTAFIPSYKAQFVQGANSIWKITSNLLGTAYDGASSIMHEGIAMTKNGAQNLADNLLAEFNDQTNAVIGSISSYKAQLTHGATTAWNTTHNLLANAYHGVSSRIMNENIEIAKNGTLNLAGNLSLDLGDQNTALFESMPSYTAQFQLTPGATAWDQTNNMQANSDSIVSIIMNDDSDIAKNNTLNLTDTLSCALDSQNNSEIAKNDTRILTDTLSSDLDDKNTVLIESTPSYTAQFVQGVMSVWDQTTNLLANAYHGVSSRIMNENIEIAKNDTQILTDTLSCALDSQNNSEIAKNDTRILTDTLSSDLNDKNTALIESTPSYTTQLVQGVMSVWGQTTNLLANAYQGVSSIMYGGIEIASHHIQDIEDFDDLQNKIEIAKNETLNLVSNLVFNFIEYEFGCDSILNTEDLSLLIELIEPKIEVIVDNMDSNDQQDLIAKLDEVNASFQQIPEIPRSFSNPEVLLQAALS